MNKEQLKALVERPEMIPGIYNYCDRWCKYCQFTERCSVFACEDEEKEKNGQVEALDYLSDIFKIAMEMITEEAEKRGIDLLAITEADQVKDEMAHRQQVLEDSPLVQMASPYPKLAENLLRKAEEQFDELVEGEVKAMTPGLGQQRNAITLEEAQEVIRWYRFQIVTKINRATAGRASDECFKENQDQHDSNGSAKVALIGLEKSISAWKLVFEQEKDEEIFDILSLLARIRQQLLLEFPKAPAFRRPGFDD